MAEIHRAAKIQEREVRTQLDRMELRMIEDLRHGNIYEVFSKSKFKISDFQDFFSNQWKVYKGNIVQDEPIKAADSSMHEPDVARFPVHNKGMSLSQEEQQMFNTGVMSFLTQQGGKFKASKVKQEEVEAEEEVDDLQKLDQPMSYEELQEMAQGTMAEWDQFMSEAWGQIMDAQMMSDYQQRMGEIQKEVDRLIAMAKSGRIGAEFVLIALAKVNATKNGVLMSWLGKKAFHVNDSINRIANDLHELSPTDPRYFSQMQLAQSQTRDKSFQLNLLTNDMQKVMQDVAGVMEQVHGIMGEMNRTRREIIMHVAARG